MWRQAGIILMFLSVFSPSVWAYGVIGRSAVSNEPATAKFSSMRVLEGVRVFSNTVNPNFPVSTLKFVKESLVQTMQKIASISIFGRTLWRDNKIREHTPLLQRWGEFIFFGHLNSRRYSGQKSWTPAYVDKIPWNNEVGRSWHIQNWERPHFLMLLYAAISGVTWLEHYPWSFQSYKLARSLSLVANFYECPDSDSACAKTNYQTTEDSPQWWPFLRLSCGTFFFYGGGWIIYSNRQTNRWRRLRGIFGFCCLAIGWFTLLLPFGW